MRKDKIYLILVLLCVWCPLFMGAWDKAKPASSTSLRNSNPQMLANQDALEVALAQDHEFSTGGTNSGKHEVLTMEEESSAGASSTDEGHLQVIDGGSQPELAFTSEDGDELQFTKDGDLYSSDNLVVDGASTLTGAVGAAGSITLGAGADFIGSSTSDITINTNKFTVAGDTGNTVVAGTLGVTGVATLGDTSALATSGAPAADAQIANKKYVDDQEGTGTGYYDADGSTVFNTTMTAATTFQELDLSGVVGSNVALIFLEVKCSAGAYYIAKPKGFGSSNVGKHISATSSDCYGVGVVDFDNGDTNTFAYIVVAADSSGIIEQAAQNNTDTFTIKVVGYIK